VRVVAFTCVLGPTPDTVRVPTSINARVRYICLTDRPSSPFPYQHVPVTTPSGPRAAELYARQLKILADHPALDGADVVLWHDAAFQLTTDPAAVAHHALERHPERDVLAFRHPDRTQIEDEAVAIAKCGYADHATCAAQAASYRAEGFTQTAITSTGYSLRRRTPKVQAFNRLWWDEVTRWCWRDQMSVDYALWKTGVVCGYIPGHYRDNPYAKWFKAPTPRTHRARPSWPFKASVRP
jgi:hypothetical protein